MKISKLKKQLKLNLKQCPCCNKHTTSIINRRLPTLYVPESRNWTESCKQCYDEDIEQVSEDWDTYWSMIAF